MPKPSLLTRWRLYRRWGSRSSWDSNIVADMSIKRHDSRGWFAEGWSLCRCGKEFYVFDGDRSRPETDEHIEQRLRMKGGLCRACTAWVHHRHNHCPDYHCFLGYWHKGRCTPYEVPDDLLARVRAAEGLGEGN